MAGIIKANQTTSKADGGVRPVAFSFGDLRAQADDYLRQVRAQGEQIIANARQTAQAQREQAMAGLKAEAEAEATQAIQQQLQQQLTTLMPSIQASIQKLDGLRNEWVASWESGVIELAVAIAESMVREKVQKPEIQQNLIREALRQAAGRRDVTLHLNPDDLQALQPAVDDLIQNMHGLANVSIAADSSVERGGCRVTTEYGEIDQQITTMISRMREELS